jgi:hypothetical protein
MRLLSLALVGWLAGLAAIVAQTPAPAKSPPKTATSAQGPASKPPAVTMPPIPNLGVGARPVDVMRAVYKFAGEHPEVLKYVPCYCGCESTGHPHNESCFVKRRDAAGNVLEWDTHGYG